MAVNIEHRDIESLLSAFDFFNTDSWAIYMGRDQRTAFSGQSKDEAEDKLQDYLKMIEQSGNSAVYTLRVYPEGTKNISTKTPSNGSTTFMLNPATGVTRTENGTVIIDRTQGKGVGDTGNNMMFNILMQRLDKTESQLEQVRKENFLLQMKILDDKVSHAIAGTQEKEKTWWEQMIEMFDKNPNMVGNIINPVKDAIKEFIPGKGKDYIIQNTTQPVAGTTAKEEPKPAEKNEDMNTEETNVDIEDGFAPDANGERHHPFIKEEERKLSEKEREKLAAERLKACNEEQMHDVQTACLDSIENRIGTETLTRMLIAVAMMNDKNINKLLNHLD